ncbi:MAG: hypothetical protein RL577_764 [Bacteroidota bacterium]
MTEPSTPLSSIERKLDAYIDQFHWHRFLRNLLLWGLGFGLSLLSLAYGEHWLWMSTSLRTLSYYLLLVVGVISVLLMVVRPLAQYRGWWPRLTREEAALQIGEHFPEVQDKLINLLQLKQAQASDAWVEAAIEQRSVALSPISFWQALDPAAFRKLAIRLSLGLGLVFIWFVLDSSRLLSGAQRLWQHDQEFTKPAPFEFCFYPSKEPWIEGQDYLISLKLKGREIPSAVRCLWGDQEYLMQSVGPDSFSFLLSGAEQGRMLRFAAGEFLSPSFELPFWAPPRFVSLRLEARYPSYLHSDAPLQWPTQGTIIVPAGTELSLVLEAANADLLKFSGSFELGKEINNGQLRFSRNVRSSEDWVYALRSNRPLTGLPAWGDSLHLHIEVVADVPPQVELEVQADSSQSGHWYLRSLASDDHGLQTMECWVKGPRQNQFSRLKVPVDYREHSAAFVADLRAQDYGAHPGEEILVYSRACDNNAVLGTQCAQSLTQVLRMPDQRELKQWQLDKQNQVESGLSKASKAQQDLQKRASDLQRSLLQESGFDADKKQSVQQWLNEQKQLQEQTQKLAESQKKLELDPAQKEQSLREKQVEESLNELKQNSELEKLMKELQQLLNEKAEPDQVRQKMQEINRMRQDIQKQLDNVQEQIKELQLERLLDQQVQQMQDWAQQEEALSEASKQAKTEAEKQAVEQAHEKQLEQLESILQRSQEIEKRDSDLEKPLGLDVPKSEQSEAQNQAEQAQQSLEKGQQKSASEQQKSAADQMRKAAEKLQKSMEEAQEERMEEDYETLRRLLANLIDLSKRQEAVFTELQTLSGENPRVLALNKQQMEIRELSTAVEDSLMALARRQPMISSIVTGEMSKVNRRMEQGLQSLKKRDLRTAAMHEQFVMTSYNTLAALLMESMQNMQQQLSAQQKKSGSQSCNNPNKQGPGQQGKPKPGQGLSQSQKALGEKLQQMQSQGQSGQSGSQGQRQLSQELGQMALMQEQLRREIQKLKQAAAEAGDPGAAHLLHEAEQLMEQQERDLINGELGSQLQFRQQEILTRLLEHEKGERKQQQDEQRRGEQSQGQSAEIPEDWALPIRKKLEEAEALHRGSVPLSWPYQQAVDQYLNRTP